MSESSKPVTAPPPAIKLCGGCTYYDVVADLEVGCGYCVVNPPVPGIAFPEQVHTISVAFTPHALWPVVEAVHKACAQYKAR